MPARLTMAHSLFAFLLFPTLIFAHMSAFLPSMYGLGTNYTYDAGDPVAPIGPNIRNLDDWWFRGPAARALTPAGRKDNVAILPAGGSLKLDITCHAAWASLGWRTTRPGSYLDACPDNPGAYHSPEPSTGLPATSGCALAIADVTDIEATTMDNLVIFSVVKDCVKQKENSFPIPKAMPKCTGKKCICGWFWLADQGLTNFYQTGFDCTVTNSLPDSTPIARPSDPVFCLPGNSSCSVTKGAKRPLYAYNNPTNVVFKHNDHRPGYHESWSFFDGPQDDIFEPKIGVVPIPRIDGIPTGPNLDTVANSTIPLPASSPIPKPTRPAPVIKSSPLARLSPSSAASQSVESSTTTDSYEEELITTLYPLSTAISSPVASATPSSTATYSSMRKERTQRPQKQIGLEGLGESNYGNETETSSAAPTSTPASTQHRKTSSTVSLNSTSTSTTRSARIATTLSTSTPSITSSPSMPTPVRASPTPQSSLSAVATPSSSSPSPPPSTVPALPNDLRRDDPLARVNLVSSAVSRRNWGFSTLFSCAGFALFVFHS